MNLIELSEQLKDVPDQLLMKEVQAPSGAYPSYLVVTELSRRKRMRDQANKQSPTTTVAQDLAQPSREDMIRAMAATQQQMAPPRLVSNAPSGIMAMPEASQALAAQDIMGAQPQGMEPQRMAAGGMVAFKQGGDIPRFQNEGLVETPLTTEQKRRILTVFPTASPSPFFGLTGALTAAVLGGSEIVNSFRNRNPVQQNSQERLGPAGALGRGFQEDYLNMGAASVDEQRVLNAALQERVNAAQDRLRTFGLRQRQQDPAGFQAAQNELLAAQQALTSPTTVGTAPAAPARAPAPAPAPAPAARRPAPPAAPAATVTPPLTMPALFQAGSTNTLYDAALAKATDARLNLREPTLDELAAERAKGINRYQTEAPFRLGFLEQDIAKQQQDLAGRRGSNINEALIQTGLGIMGSKSPRFLQAAGEAGTTGLNAYRQGLKDIRESERNLLQSRVSFANAQSLYDQNKVAAGDKAQQDAISRYQRAMDLANTNSAMLARARDSELNRLRLEQEGKRAEHAAGLDAVRAQMAMQKLPGEIALAQAQAAAQTAAAGSSKAYQDYLRAGGKKPAAKPMTAEDILALRGIAEAALKKRNLPITEENIQRAIASMRSTGAISVGPPDPTSASYADLIGSK